MKSKCVFSFILTFFSFVNFNLSDAMGQDTLTFRNVYDFNVDDEFQYKTLNIPPNVLRIKITGKRFSYNNDTVFYTRHFNGYSSVPNMTTSPPHLDYTFSSGNDSIFYTNLDLTLHSYYITPTDSCDSFYDTSYYASQFCGKQVYEYNNCLACCFEGFGNNDIYGKGLGRIWHHYSFPAEGTDEQIEMTYYKKDTMVCGVSDTTFTTAVIDFKEQKEILLLFPNPAIDFIELKTDFKRGWLSIYDNLGKLILKENMAQIKTPIDLSYLSSGLYFITVQDNSINVSQKFIKQ